MPRKPRIISSTGIYHVILRSVNQQIIFEEDFDYQKFLFQLYDCKKKYGVDIFAYCLMDNHIHLMLYSPNNTLSSFFQSLGTRFVRWYNNKYSRSGHLFQERFHSIPIESSPQYLATLLYIHNNPVKAMICRYPSEYRWSSYNCFYGQKNPLINLSLSHKIAGSKALLLKYFAENSSHSSMLDQKLSPNLLKTKRHFLTDEKALDIFRSVTNLYSTSDVVKLTKIARNKYIRQLHQMGLTQKQTARLMNVSITTVRRLIQKEPFEES